MAVEHGVHRAAGGNAQPRPPGAGQPFRYTGRRFDPETGLYYYRARYYSASLGRFLQVDPVGYDDQMNLYAYVGNDPMNDVDPTGRCINDPLCTGIFSGPSAIPTGPQTNDGLQDFFNFRTNPQITDTYIADPVQFGIEEQIDVGSQIQSSIANGGRARPYYDAAVKNGGTGNFVMNHVAFGQGLTNIFSKAGQGIGRFTGDVAGTITVAKDGSYTVSGTLNLDYGPYNWTPDRKSFLGNLAIRSGGARYNVPGPGSPYRLQYGLRGNGAALVLKPGAVRYRNGTQFKPVPNRTYSFTAFGN